MLYRRYVSAKQRTNVCSETEKVLTPSYYGSEPSDEKEDLEPEEKTEPEEEDSVELEEKGEEYTGENNTSLNLQVTKIQITLGEDIL